MINEVHIKVADTKLVPVRAHPTDAGADLRSNNETFTLKMGEKVKVYTGVKMEIPVGYVGLIVPRSGLGSKYRVTIANNVGVIDSDYRGEIMAFLVNDGAEDVQIEKYERICQIMIVPVALVSFNVVPKLSETGRGEGGFGHTGKDEHVGNKPTKEGLEGTVEPTKEAKQAEIKAKIEASRAK